MRIFTGVQGEQYGYRDGWIEDGVFLSIGEFQSGRCRRRGGGRLFRRTDRRYKLFHATDGHLRWGDAAFNLRSGRGDTTGFHQKSPIIGYNLSRDKYSLRDQTLPCGMVIELSRREWFKSECGETAHNLPNLIRLVYNEY